MSVEDHTKIHALYCALTDNHDLVLTMPRHYAWSAWKARGWTEDDLKLVVAHLKAKVKAGRKWDSCLQFGRLITFTEHFEEELSEARALARIPRTNPGKASVLRATGRPAHPPSSPARTPEQIMRGNEQLKKLLDLRDNL